jgi:hypothetical protein
MRIAGPFLALVLGCLAPAARAGEAEAKPKGEPKPGKKAKADPKTEREGKADSGPKYDDRVIFEQLRRASAAAWQLIPNSRWALTKPKAFDDKRLTGQLAEFGKAVKILEGALKRKDDPEALVAQRSKVKKRIEAFLAEMGEYKKAYAAAAAAEQELARLKKSSPRSRRRNNQRNNRNNRNDRNEMRRWSDSITKARKKAETATLEMNRRYVRAQALCRAVASTLASIRSSVRRIYETVIEKPVEVEFLVEVPAEQPGKPSARGRLGGDQSRSALLEGSACTAESFRRAVGHEERAFLEGLGWRMVLWRVIPIEAVKESGGRLTSRAMVGGSPTTFEFPPAPTPDGFRPGSSLLVAGEVREVRGEWSVRVIGWGPWGKVEAGGAMNLCTWPEPEPE